MNNQNLAISILENKTKIVVFQITKYKNIIINEVHIIDKFISKNKVQKTIKKVLKTFTINQTFISVYNNCSKPTLIDIKNIFLILDLKNYEIINEAIKCIDKDKLKTIETKLKYIKNGWLDFSQITNIDLNGLIYYTLNKNIVTIEYKNIFEFRDNCSKMTVNSMMTRSHGRKAYNERLTFLAKKCKNINEVIEVLKADNTKPSKPTKQDYYFILVTIDDEEYILSYNYCIVTPDAVKKAKFTPYIKYDIDDVRIDTIEPLECKLFNCKNIKEQISTIDNYIKKPYRRFKKWETKPSKIFLYHSYNEEPKEFKIIYNKHIS